MSGDRAPARPQRESFDQLGFRPRAATRWLSPRRWARTTADSTLAVLAGSFTDRRETLAALDRRPEPVEDLDLSERRELWIDYVADTGDGFDHTYPVAWLLAQDELVVEGHPTPLPAGDLLVFGGDQVYPVASDIEYRDRFVGPFRAALPWRDEGAVRGAVAIPGNHDWYDGLGGFARRFCQQRWLGGWRTFQRRSYVAVRLPHHWWLWGVDIALAGLVDHAQLEYFDAVARRAASLAASDGAVARLVLVTAKPTWLDAPLGAPEEARVDPALDYLESSVARRHGVEVAAVLTGDTHYYARYQPIGSGPQRVIYGGGGAFVHPTDHTPERLSIARRAWPGHERDEELALAALAPSPQQSHRLRWRALWFGFRNGAFPAMTALAYLVWLLPAVGRTVAVLGMFAALSALARRGSLARGAVWGAPHTAAHVAVMMLAIFVTDEIASGPATSEWARAGSLLVAGALVAPVVMGLYFVVVGTVAGVNDNEAFSAIRVRGHKGFLRLHLDTTGSLALHAIAVEDLPPRSAWKLVTDAPPDAPWFGPVEGRRPRPKLIDGPLELS